MSTTPKNGRIDLRLSTTQKGRIEQAAALTGRTVTDFSVDVLVREAEDVIQRERVMMVDTATWDAFSAVVDRPAQSVSGLADLLRRPSVFTD